MNWLNCYTAERFGINDESINDRSGFERDYDRIIFSAAFRRLQNKTQVFPLPEHVFVHNRLTHSLEVVSVGRSLGKMVGESLSALAEVSAHEPAVDFYRNQLKNVVSAACLAHDLGNPAFGHSGEQAISRYFREKEKDQQFKSRFTEAEWQDLINFEGNANALRILTRQFNGRMKGGYRLTYSTLGAILKYPCESQGTIKQKGRPKHRSKYGFFQAEKQVFSEIANKLHMHSEERDPLVYKRHPFVYLVEAADDISYSIIDYEDAHRLGILSFEEVKSDFMNLLSHNENENFEKLHQNLNFLQKDRNESIAYLRAKCINFLVTEAAANFMNSKDEILNGNYQGSLISNSVHLQQALEQIEKTSVERVYGHQSVVKIELAGFRIMSGLIEDLADAALSVNPELRHKKLLNLMPLQYHFDPSQSDYEKVMCILDFVSGMTDNYALELYRNLRGISVPVI